MNLQNRLMYQAIAYQILYSHEVAQNYNLGIYTLRTKDLINWRIEMLAFIKNTSDNAMLFVLDILKKENNVTYLEILDLYNTYKQEKHVKLFKGLKWLSFKRPHKIKNDKIVTMPV